MEVQERIEKQIEVTGENAASAQSALKASAVNKMSGAEKASVAEQEKPDRAEAMKEDLLTVRGFRFTAIADAKTAEEEYKKMVYINDHMNKENPEEWLTEIQLPIR